MSKPIKIILPRVALFLSVALYIACLFEDGFVCCSSPSQGGTCGMSGIAALIWGAISFPTAFQYPAMVAWFANPILSYAWTCFLLGARTGAIVLALLAFALASSFMFVKTVPGGTAQPSEITGVALGYWLWLASIVMTFLGALLLRPKRQQGGVGRE